MANELVHASQGTTLTQAEFEAVGLHVCNSQATGDLIYASSSTQLSRLAIGAADTILTCNGTIPSWSTTPILNTAVAKGAWTASGTWTIPAVTLGGNVDAGGNRSIVNLVGVTGRSAALELGFYGMRTNANAGTAINFYTNNNADSYTTRLAITGGANQATATLSATHLLHGTNYSEFTEMAAPGAGAANTARVYAVVNGVLTTLAAVFQDGTVDVFATEATPLDAPILTYPSGTEAKVMLKKGHPGLVTLVAKFPNGKEFVMKEFHYHNADKIAANKGCDSPLPTDWFVETAQERQARVEQEEAEKLAEVDARRQ